MMTTDDISLKLRSLDLRHKWDGDGGYSLVREVLEYAGTLSPDKRDILRDKLLWLVATQDATLWGVALEGLVQMWGSEVSTDLASMLTDERHPEEWEAQILLALLRLGHQAIFEKSVNHISRRLSAGDRTVLPLLAALSRLHADACLEMAGPFFARQVNSGQIDKLSGYVPAFVSHFVDVDMALPARFVRSIMAADNQAGRKVAEVIRKYVHRPDVHRRLGEATVKALEDSINAARSGA